jgi:hypothetical protein
VDDETIDEDSHVEYLEETSNEYEVLVYVDVLVASRGIHLRDNISYR